MELTDMRQPRRAECSMIYFRFFSALQAGNEHFFEITFLRIILKNDWDGVSQWK